MKFNKQNWKLLNLLNKKNNKNRKKSSRKKRRIFSYAVLIVNLFFGNLKTKDLKTQDYSNVTPLTQEKVILAREFNNSLDDPRNSGQTSIVFAFQEDQIQISEYNINDRDEIILVKNEKDNDGILPGADAFPLNTNNKSPYSHLFRSQLKNRGFDSSLDGSKKNRGNHSSLQLDMKKEYETFIRKMRDKGYYIECSQERFNELSTNSEKNKIDEKSMIEAKGGLQGEAEGMYENLRRPSNKAVNLDFEIDSVDGYTHLDYKTPIDFQDLEEQEGIDVSEFPTLEEVAYNMGKKIPRQKKGFCNAPSGPKSPDNVLHVVNLDLIRDSDMKQKMMKLVLKGAKDTGSSTVGIKFLNHL